jgi:3-deoxy-D-manno-octulosonic-acid transferase
MRFLYNILLATGLLFVLPARLLYLFFTRKYHHSEWERLGLGSVKRNIREGSLWIHASSVGELNAVSPLINCMTSGDSGRSILITTMTPTGHDLAIKKYGGLSTVSYVPVDLPGIINKVWDVARPRVLVLVETEIWPNLLNQARISGTPVVIVNGRLRERTVSSFRKWSGLFGPALDALTTVCVQSEVEKSKYLEAGVKAECIIVTGNMKYDVDIPEINRDLFKDKFRISSEARVIVAGSTHGGEEELVLEAFKACCEIDGNTVLVIAPRHDRRFSEIANLLEREGCNYKKRTDLKEKPHDPLTGGQVLLLDTLGELSEVYGSAEMVILGGSFAKIGGHNPVEPAGWGVPIIIGPHHDTITVDAAFLSDTGGLVVVDETGLVDQCRKWWGNQDELEVMGGILREKLVENKGAALRNFEIIQKIMDENG